MCSSQRCFIVPPHVLRGLADSSEAPEDVRARAREGLKYLQSLLEGHPGVKNAHRAAGGKPPKDDNATVERFLHDAENSLNEGDLPGKLVRAEKDPKVEDKAVNEAFNNVGTVLDFYKEHFKWNSIDNKGADVVSTVHFGKSYENACRFSSSSSADAAPNVPPVWDPQRYQMVFGDGDDFLNNFTGCIDVIGHELTHAVTDHTSPLDYWGMPGALNEHVSDVFGIMVKQKVQDENAKNADWLVGEDCILPGVKGTALRSMKAPGKAYDDPRFVRTFAPLVMLLPLTPNRARTPKSRTWTLGRQCSRTMAASTSSLVFPTRLFTLPLWLSVAILGKRPARSGGRR